MALPIVVTKALAAGLTTSFVNAQNTVAALTALTLVTTVVGTSQRRLLLTTTADETANTFVIVGTNDAGFTITENLVGVNNATVQSNLDFKTLTSIKPLVTTAGTVSFGVNTVGSSLWFIQNWHVTPTNIEISGVLVGVLGVNYTIQYTYDDPNNLPATVGYPQPFNHPTLASATTSLDGSIDNPITAWRLTINSGTGTVRATGIQAGIGSP